VQTIGCHTPGAMFRRKSTDRNVVVALEGPLNSWLNEGNQRALEALSRNREWGIEAAEEWFFDQDTALLTFTFPERVIVTPFQFLGSHNAKAGTWMWAWANDSIDPRLKADSMALREVGELLGHQIFTERILNVSEEDADCMALLALKESRHDGLYKAPDGEQVTFLSFGQPFSP
jgi:hypothetical protein